MSNETSPEISTDADTSAEIPEAFNLNGGVSYPMCRNQVTVYFPFVAGRGYDAIANAIDTGTDPEKSLEVALEIGPKGLAVTFNQATLPNNPASKYRSHVHIKEGFAAYSSVPVKVRVTAVVQTNGDLDLSIQKV